MLGKKLASSILSQAISYSPADETEIMLTGGKSYSCRFANNYIHQNGLQKDYVLTVRVAFGNKVGTASCNIFDGDNLRRAVDDACSIARHSEPDQEWVSILHPHTYEIFPQTYFDETVHCPSQEVVSWLEPVFKTCLSHSLLGAGMITYGDEMVSIMNSQHLFAYHASTSASLTFTARHESSQSSGWAEYHAPNIYDIQVETVVQGAIEKALKGKTPLELEPGSYSVILEPPASVSLIEWLAYIGFGGQSYQQGRSFVVNRLGQQLFDQRLTLIDDPSRWEVLGVPFDMEGHPKQRTPLIEAGTVKQVVHDRRTAKQCQTHSSGHALMPPNLHGPLATNVILEAGEDSLETMIANTERGVYVTRFWYDNMVDEKQAIITGMTRDGTFLIEDGKLTKPLRNMRYNQSLLEAFNHVGGIGNTLMAFNGYFGKLAVPVLKLENFHFTGVSGY